MSDTADAMRLQMADVKSFFDAWAPYWSFIEDNALDTISINKLAKMLESPVLIVGAGQGILVEQLRDKGLKAEGIDLCPAMIQYAKQRRNIDLIQADARNMPFDDNAFQSTIIATGVVDFMDGEDDIKAIINEVKRVTSNAGHISVAFYRFHPKVEELMRYLGMLSEDRYHIRRTQELTSFKPSQFVAELKKKPNVSTLGSLFTVIRKQLSLPKKERALLKNWKLVWQRAQKEMDNPKVLIDSAPESVPYRNEARIHELFSSLNISLADTHVLYSCTVAQLQ